MNDLQQLLEAGLAHDPHYLPSMNSDHLPMVLCAITGLGGDMAACLAFREGYAPRLRPVVAGPDLDDWRQGVGRPECYAALLAWFLAEVKDKGIDASVRQYLPEFFPSLAQRAFHAVIRLAYAIDFASEAETAAALAYVVSSYTETPVDESRTVDIEQAMHKQAEQPVRTFEATRFAARVSQLIRQEDYPTGCASSLASCASLALDVYLGTRDFFALHMVTATHASRICLPYLDEKSGLAALTGALLAAHIVVGSPHFHTRAALVSQGEDHDLKFAWSCLSEYRCYGDERYLEEIRLLKDAHLIPAWCADA